LKKEQDEICNSEDEDDGNSTDFHDRISPFFHKRTAEGREDWNPKILPGSFS
jgi:hypothetical protein